MFKNQKKKSQPIIDILVVYWSLNCIGERSINSRSNPWFSRKGFWSKFLIISLCDFKIYDQSTDFTGFKKKKISSIN